MRSSGDEVSNSSHPKGEMETKWRRDISDVRTHRVCGQHFRKFEFSGWRCDIAM